MDTSRKKGFEEEKILIAKEMKADGFSLAQIMRYTGLSEDELNNLY